METTCDYHYPLGESSSSNPRKRKRTNKFITRKPGPDITRPCTECGRKFWSWKALFGHMRCHPEREWRGIVPPPNIRRSRQEDIDSEEEDHQVAAYLLMLANGPGPPPEEEEGGRFECSSCKKVFGSHQALGGHRASHKNVKGCYAITKISSIDDDDDDDDDIDGEEANDCHSGGRHRCSICFRVFSSGQALGGHMRCHWEKVDDPASSSRVFAFDLNLNLNQDDDHDACVACSPLELRLGL